MGHNKMNNKIKENSVSWDLRYHGVRAHAQVQVPSLMYFAISKALTHHVRLGF